MRYAKLLAPVVGVFLTALASALLDQHVTTIETLMIIVAVVQAVSVGIAGFLPAGLLWPKTAVAAVLAGTQLLIVYVTSSGHLGAVTTTEWINVVIAILVTAGVAVTPVPVQPAPPPAA
jgi:hypothetical protein